MRQKRYRYAFRKALLHAASKDPDCAGQLIQELRKVSQTPSRYPHSTLDSNLPRAWLVSFNIICQWIISQNS